MSLGPSFFVLSDRLGASYGMKRIIKNRTDASKTGQRINVTVRQRCLRSLPTWLMSILLLATLQAASANETVMPDPHTRTTSPGWLTDAWHTFQSKFISPEGRVMDDANGGISHSEGQGYAMLMAVRAGDRAAFDRLWTWTRANLELRGDNLA